MENHVLQDDLVNEKINEVKTERLFPKAGCLTNRGQTLNGQKRNQ